MRGKLLAAAGSNGKRNLFARKLGEYSRNSVQYLTDMLYKCSEKKNEAYTSLKCLDIIDEEPNCVEKLLEIFKLYLGGSPGVATTDEESKEEEASETTLLERLKNERKRLVEDSKFYTKCQDIVLDSCFVKVLRLELGFIFYNHHDSSGVSSIKLDIYIIYLELHIQH